MNNTEQQRAFRITAPGLDYGVYIAATAQAARDSCMVDEGYVDEADAIAANLGEDGEPGDLVCVEVPWSGQ